jgi:hypothetical protein
MSSIPDPLDSFLGSSERAEWLIFSNKEVFVRKARHYHPQQKAVVRCFDIANVVVFDPGKGTFSRWLKELSETLRSRGYAFIYIESVLNRRLLKHLRSKGVYETPEGFNFFIPL